MGFISDVIVIVRGRSVVMPTPSPSPFFQRSPRPFKLFRARVKGEGLGSEAIEHSKRASWFVIESHVTFPDPTPFRPAQKRGRGQG